MHGRTLTGFPEVTGESEQRVMSLRLPRQSWYRYSMTTMVSSPSIVVVNNFRELDACGLHVDRSRPNERAYCVLGVV